jgi:ParB-like chromosome segregation protein Spo0J
MKIGDHDTHPAADVFPLMVGDELAELAADILANGLNEPIWTDEGELILDGRNRAKACIIAGVKPRFRVFRGGPAKILAFVWSQNGPRRNLNPSQRALAAARMAALVPGRPAKGRQTAGIRQADVAKRADVGERSVSRARHVLDQAVPEVVAAIDRGELALGAAEELVRLPAEEQRAAIAKLEQPTGPIAGKAVRALLDQQGDGTSRTPTMQLLNAIEHAITRIGGTCARLDAKGVHVGFAGRVYLVQLVQQASTRSAA